MIRILSLLLLCLFASPANAADLNYEAFSKLPVQHEGRIKPLDTFARSYLKNFSGSEKLKDITADQWLAETLFNPGDALSRPLFRVLRPDMIGLPEKEGKLYSYAELTTALKDKSATIDKLVTTDSKNWSHDQKELMQLQEQSILYAQLLRSFSLILPFNIPVPDQLAKDWKLKQGSLMTLQQFQKFDTRLAEKIKTIVRKKGEDPEKYSESEKDIAAFAYQMQVLKSGGDFNVLFRIIPSVWDNKDGEWFSPWALTQAGKGSPQSAKLLSLWEQTAGAYLQNDPATFVASVTAMNDLYKPYINSSKNNLELAYNAYHPLGMAMIAYLLAFLFYAGSAIFNRRPFYALSCIALTTAMMLHLAAIAGRVLILSRPPVGTLYESMLFVSLICAAIAALIEWRRRDGTGLLIGSISGMILLFLSQAFAADDTMKMLVAVLNTNFWLGTHVLCITIGYAVCLIAACMAHVCLFQASVGKSISDMMPGLKTMGLIALLFTAIGTILGGIWADQSWGRFWGWDPKENGALLIVLWLIWLFHGNISGHLKRLAFVASLAALNIIVALAWFGVNLLNVGLHSYGFITGVAASLGAFCTAEILLIAYFWHRARKWEKSA